jgi:metallophosphoesterase superfamily enzyme
VLCGHVHPAYSLVDFDGSRVRLPCFVIDDPHCAMLPAFGTFTGGTTVKAAEGRKIFVASGRRVLACGDRCA